MMSPIPCPRTTTTFDSGAFGAGASFQLTAGPPGTYTYFCQIHPFMKGTLTVTAIDGGVGRTQLVVAMLLLASVARLASAQSVTDRTPNLDDGWTVRPG